MVVEYQATSLLSKFREGQLFSDGVDIDIGDSFIDSNDNNISQLWHEEANLIGLDQESARELLVVVIGSPSTLTVNEDPETHHYKIVMSLRDDVFVSDLQH